MENQGQFLRAVAIRNIPPKLVVISNLAKPRLPQVISLCQILKLRTARQYHNFNTIGQLEWLLWVYVISRHFSFAGIYYMAAVHSFNTNLPYLLCYYWDFFYYSHNYNNINEWQCDLPICLVKCGRKLLIHSQLHWLHRWVLKLEKNIILHFRMDAITYTCWDLRWSV